MSGGAELPQDARPLRLVPGYLITPDGRVFRAKDGKEAKSLTLRKAREYAKTDLHFDPEACRLQPLGPVQPDSLTGSDDLIEIRVGPDGPTERILRRIEITRWVRQPTPEELERADAGSAAADELPAITYLAGGILPAVGDTREGWYRVPHDGAWVLFHGASLAQYEKQQAKRLQ